MNWSSVKNLMIAILAAANLFLIFNIVRQDRTRGYLDEDEVVGAIELLAERGLVIPKDAVPLEKFSAPVYESLYSDEYYTEVAEALTGSKREMLYTLPEGGISITALNGNTVEFDTEFGFRYTEFDISELSAYTDITAEGFASFAAARDEVPAPRIKTLSAACEEFLGSDLPSEHALTTAVSNACHDSRSGLTYLLAHQTLDGFEVYSHYAVCIFNGDDLVFAKGRWYFAPFDETYNTELCDQVNILFADLATLKNNVSAASDGNSAPGTPSEDDGNISGPLPQVTSISACYVIYWNSDKTSLYFMPAWQIEHNNNQTIVYNATNSTVYSVGE